MRQKEKMSIFFLKHDYEYKLIKQNHSLDQQQDFFPSIIKENFEIRANFHLSYLKTYLY